MNQQLSFDFHNWFIVPNQWSNEVVHIADEFHSSRGLGKNMFYSEKEAREWAESQGIIIQEGYPYKW